MCLHFLYVHPCHHTFIVFAQSCPRARLVNHDCHYEEPGAEFTEVLMKTDCDSCKEAERETQREAEERARREGEAVEVEEASDRDRERQRDGGGGTGAEPRSRSRAIDIPRRKSGQR